MSIEDCLRGQHNVHGRKRTCACGYFTSRMHLTYVSYEEPQYGFSLQQARLHQAALELQEAVVSAWILPLVVRLNRWMLDLEAWLQRLRS